MKNAQRNKEFLKILNLLKFKWFWFIPIIGVFMYYTNSEIEVLCFDDNLKNKNEYKSWATNVTIFAKNGWKPLLILCSFAILIVCLITSTVFYPYYGEIYVWFLIGVCIAIVLWNIFSLLLIYIWLRSFLVRTYRNVTKRNDLTFEQIKNEIYQKSKQSKSKKNSKTTQK